MSTTAHAPERRGQIATARRLHVALVGAAALLAVTSSGDLFFLVGLLALMTADPVVAGVASLSVVAVITRFGTSSLATVAGAQGVLGPAVLLGDPASAVAMALAGLALALISPRGLPVVAFGLASGAVWAGAAPGDPADWLWRIGASAVGLSSAWAAARYLPRRAARVSSAACGGLAVLLAGVGRLL